MSEADLAGYQARIVDAQTVAYRNGRIHVAPGLTGGPTLVHALSILEDEWAPVRGTPGAESYVAYARALDEAFNTRLAGMGDAAGIAEAAQAPSCTTHFSIVDRHGNMCSVTQTLLSIFGSRVVSPSTGLLLNNGIMWFDPEPGKPNSIGPGKRCLGNFCPTIGEDGDGRRFALGASGGRKIIGAVMQIFSFIVDHGLTLEQAFHQQRIDMSGGGKATADRTLPQPVLDALAAAFPTTTAVRTNFPYAFACPAAVLRDGDLNMGCTEIMSPWGDAVAEGPFSELRTLLIHGEGTFHVRPRSSACHIQQEASDGSGRHRLDRSDLDWRNCRLAGREGYRQQYGPAGEYHIGHDRRGRGRVAVRHVRRSDAGRLARLSDRRLRWRLSPDPGDAAVLSVPLSCLGNHQAQPPVAANLTSA